MEWPAGKLKSVFLQLVLRLSLRIKALERSAVGGRSPRFETTAQQWNEVRAAWRVATGHNMALGDDGVWTLEPQATPPSSLTFMVDWL